MTVACLRQVWQLTDTLGANHLGDTLNTKLSERSGLEDSTDFRMRGSTE